MLAVLLTFAHCDGPLAFAEEPTEHNVKFADGAILPIEHWPDTYETLEWQPPIDIKKAKTIVDYGGGQISSVGIDYKHNKIYWIFGG
ncbi:MAG TPA: hypothetical protein VHV77_04370, partial [Pirellulales bacterium]|nr:hypothetical protein [Pirellulales bacterium]